MLIEARFLKSVHGFETGDSILSHPALGTNLALVRLLKADYGHLVQLGDMDAIEYLTGPLFPHEVERVLKMQFRTLQARSRGIELLR